MMGFLGELVGMIPKNIPGKLPKDEFECWEISVDLE
jgi:hypothetical protein